jgi:glycosyltransferase involved in cell wall biosynthesis
MRVFMLGWEFPPFISGGLGTACYGLTKAMSGIGTDVLFVLPRPVSTPFSTHVRLVSPRPGSPLASPSTEFRLDEFERVTFRTIDAQMGNPYQSPEDYVVNPGAGVGTEGGGVTGGQVVEERRRVTKATPVAQTVDVAGPGAALSAKADKAGTRGFIGNADKAPAGDHYGGDLFSEIQRYAALAGEISRHESFDVVHAHDWMTFPAGMAVAGLKGAPLVVHVHSTEFDRSGEHVDQRIYDIERRGMHAAMKVIAVSHLTKTLIVHHYGIHPDKVEVVYNAIEAYGNHFDTD